MKIDFNYIQIDTLIDMTLYERGSVENSIVFTDEYKKVVLPELDLIFKILDNALGPAAREESKGGHNEEKEG